jgi:hypothetical protein
MSTYLTVSPAYGRDYRSGKAALQDWLDGKDFRIETVGRDAGRMINLPQAEDAGLKVMIRYKALTQVVGQPDKYYRAHVYTHDGTWLAQANFLKRPDREAIEEKMEALRGPGRFEVRVGVVQGGVERGGWGWLQGVAPAEAPAGPEGCRHCAGGAS